MIRIAVCDDEAAMCAQLEEQVSRLLKKLNEPFRIVCYTSAPSLLDAASEYDLIFLDIQIPDLNGVALANILREKNCPCALIFVTVLQDCMLDAFEVEAAGYLCKPVDDVRLESALKRVLKQLRGKQEDCLFIRTMNWCRSVKLHEICYCEVINRKIFLHTQTEVIEYYGRLKDLKKQLNGQLFQCHRSYLVNPAYLREYADGQLLLEDGSRIPAARSRRQALMETMLQFMKKGE